MIALAPRASAQTTPADLLSLSLSRDGDTLTARVFLDTVQGGIEGVSFAVCHATDDAILEDAAVGPGIPGAAGPAGADFVAVRAGGSAGEAFVTMVAVLDFEGRARFRAGTHELLELRFALRPGRSGGSVRFCGAGEAQVDTYVARPGGSSRPRMQILDEEGESEIRVGSVSSTIGYAEVPVYFTTNRTGLTGFTLVLCDQGETTTYQSGNARASQELLAYGPIRFESTEGVIIVDCDGTQVETPPDGRPYLESDALCPLGIPNCTAFYAGTRVSVELERPMPRLHNVPLLFVSYRGTFTDGGSGPIGFCEVGRDVECQFSFFGEECSNVDNTVTELRFEGETVSPRLRAGSVAITHSGEGPTYRIEPSRIGIADPVEIGVSLFQSSAPDRFLRAFETTVAFDPALFSVVEEPTVTAHRGPGLSGWIQFEGVATETRGYHEGFFTHFFDFGPCGASTRSICQPISFLELRLTPKLLSLPGGGSARVAGGPFPLELRPLVSGAQTVASNRYQDIFFPIFECGPPATKVPRLENGSVTIADSGIAFEVSSATVQVFEPAQVTISIDAPVAGVTALTYTLEHDPAVVSLERVEDSPALAALAPSSSTFEIRPDGYKHTVVLGEPLEPSTGFPLSIATYRAASPPERSSAITIDTAGDDRPIVLFPIEGERVAYVPMLNAPGEVRIEEDPSILGFRVASARTAPGSTAVASVLLDAGAPGVGLLTGTLRHDSALASVDPAYLGQDPIHLGAALAAIPGIAHTVDPAPGGVSFAAQWSGEGLPRAEGLEVFRIGYRLEGRYGDALHLELAAPAGVAGTLPQVGQGGGGGLPPGATPVENLEGAELLLTDPLAASIDPGATPGDLLAVAVTEFGWRWGITAGSSTVRHHGADGAPFGPDLELPAPPRRISSGGEGWAWASYPGHVAVLRFDALEGDIDVAGEPHGIAVDRERNAWVAVAGETGRLLRLGRDGRILRDVALPFPEPREVAIDEEGALWVAYDGSETLSRIAADGSVVRPEAARLRSTRSAGLAADGRGTLWASDAGDRSLLAFNLAGREVARLALPSEPTDVSVDGAGDLWTVLLDPDRLVRIDPASADLAEVKPAQTRHGDRTGLLALRLMVPQEDSDLDLIANLVEVRNGTDPLDPADPPADRSVPPVEDLEAVVLAVRLGPGGIENRVGVTWRNAQAYTAHEVTLDGRVVAADLGGDATSAALEGIPPGPSRVGVTSFIGNRASPEASTTIQVGPGTSVNVAGIADIEAADLAQDPEAGRIFVLDARSNEVAVLDEALRELGRFAVPLPLGSLENVLTGIAFRPPAGGGAGGGIPGSDGSLLVLDGFAGRYQEISTSGALLSGPFAVPFPAGAFFTKLSLGEVDGEPRVFTVASGPQNDCIIFFRLGSDGPFGEIEHPLASEPGVRLSLGGLAFDATGGTQRLWIATGLEGEVLPRLALGVPLGGGGSVSKVFFNLFDAPGGTAQLRGIEVSPRNGEFQALTSDSRLHLLSAFGVAREEGAVPEIGAVGGGGGEGGGGGIGLPGAVGPLEGGTRVVIEGANLGQDPDDVKVLFGRREAEVVALERAGAADRLTVLSPPGEAAGPVPILVFRTRGLDFTDPGFVYCDLPAGTEPDCNQDGVPDACQLPLGDCDRDGTLDACQFELADCNSNGVLDGCDIAGGTSLDLDADGIPDECVKFDRRDPNGDGEGDISDALHVLGFLFLGTPSEMACRKSGDANDDGDVNVSDPLYLLNFLFSGTAAAPPAPSGACGYDPTPDLLPCVAHPACRE